MAAHTASPTRCDKSPPAHSSAPFRIQTPTSPTTRRSAETAAESSVLEIHTPPGTAGPPPETPPPPHTDPNKPHPPTGRHAAARPRRSRRALPSRTEPSETESPAPGPPHTRPFA